MGHPKYSSVLHALSAHTLGVWCLACLRRVAQIQRDIWEAVMLGDWRVENALIRNVGMEAGDTAWLHVSLDSSKYYVKWRDRERMGKEARYSYERMLRRTASLDEEAAQDGSEARSTKGMGH